MGWSSGSRLFHAVIEAVKDNVPDMETRKHIYGYVLEAFEQADWDEPEECVGEDEAYDEMLQERRSLSET